MLIQQKLPPPVLLLVILPAGLLVNSGSDLAFSFHLSAVCDTLCFETFILILYYLSYISLYSCKKLCENYVLSNIT